MRMSNSSAILTVRRWDFPATRSGAEIRLLRHIFTPREAEIATFLTYKFEPLERIFERAGRRWREHRKTGGDP